MSCNDPQRRLAALTADRELGRLAVNNQLSLRYCRWRPASPRGQVLLLSGRGGFLEKYYSTVARLLERRLEVISFDWRGQGLSSRVLDDPQRGHIDDFTDYIDDLQLIWNQLCQHQYATQPYLLAHSMGAHIALRWLAEQQPEARPFRHAWITAPLAGVQTRPYPQLVARAIATIACSAGGAQWYVPGGGAFSPVSYRELGLAKLSADRQQMEYELACLQSNPALQLGASTFGWLRALFRSLDQLRCPHYLERVAQPITQFFAAVEQVVDNTACMDWQQRLPNCQSQTLALARHDLLVEIDGLQAPIWSAIDRQLTEDFDQL